MWSLLRPKIIVIFMFVSHSWTEGLVLLVSSRLVHVGSLRVSDRSVPTSAFLKPASAKGDEASRSIREEASSFRVHSVSGMQGIRVTSRLRVRIRFGMHASGGRERTFIRSSDVM
ncbi:unnamed protein product [Leuciscus chuanchicus]